MKTIEQKAQRYDEALERAKVIYQGSYKPDTAATIAETLQNIFPELKESEDEKISALEAINEEKVDNANNGQCCELSVYEDEDENIKEVQIWF